MSGEVRDRLWPLRQHADPGVGFGREESVDGFADVGDRLQVGGPDLLVGEAVGPQQHARLGLDPGLDLDLPLVRDRDRRGRDAGQEVRRESPRTAGVAPYDPWSGSPSRHSAAQMIVPPGRTTSAAADMPLTAWYRFWSSG